MCSMVATVNNAVLFTCKLRQETLTDLTNTVPIPPQKKQW